MIRIEMRDDRVYTYSDAGMKILQVETGIVYEDALKAQETPIVTIKKYIVTIKDLTNEQAQELKNKYENCEIKKQ